MAVSNAANQVRKRRHNCSIHGSFDPYFHDLHTILVLELDSNLEISRPRPLLAGIRTSTSRK